jgi:hypothetical protein
MIMNKFSLLFAIFISVNSFAQVSEKENNVVLTKENIREQVVAALPNPNQENKDKIYDTKAVDVKPEFPGGMKFFFLYVEKKLKISDELKNKKIKGKVYVTFVVEKSGELTDIKVIRDIGYGTKEEVEKILKSSPKWKPATLDGKPVRCHYSLPIPIDATK